VLLILVIQKHELCTLKTIVELCFCFFLAIFCWWAFGFGFFLMICPSFYHCISNNLLCMVTDAKELSLHQRYHSTSSPRQWTSFSMVEATQFWSKVTDYSLHLPWLLIRVLIAKQAPMLMKWHECLLMRHQKVPNFFKEICSIFCCLHDEWW
jgi:hypothetical protein